jgi:hypothetical protein
MSTSQIIPSQEARTLLEKLTPAERDYVLFCLVSEKVEDEHLETKVPVYRPDGTVFGFIHPSEPPSLEDVAVMHERARRMTSASSRSARELLESMRAGDEDAVRKYVKE